VPHLDFRTTRDGPLAVIEAVGDLSGPTVLEEELSMSERLEFVAGPEDVR
jgi:hypothetical protein